MLHEYNGDSGYEAESKPDEEEDETLMNDSFQGSGSYKGEVTANTPDTQKTFNVYSEGNSPHSPSSKFSNMSNGRTPSDSFSSGKVSPTVSDNKIPSYDYTDPVIDTRLDFTKEKPSITVSSSDQYV